MQVLIVEDQKALADTIKEFLKLRKVNCVCCYDGISGEDEASLNIYDVIVLDIMLPKKDGIEVLKDLRKRKIYTPILLLTAKSTLNDKIIGLNAGADDYLTKPFEMEELVARIYTLARRKEKEYIAALKYNDIELDNINHEVKNINSPNLLSIKLSNKEYAILEILIKNGNHVTNKDYLIDKVWAGSETGDYNSLEVYIAFVRKKLKAIESKTTIQSLRNLGYKLC